MHLGKICVCFSAENYGASGLSLTVALDQRTAHYSLHQLLYLPGNRSTSSRHNPDASPVTFPNTSEYFLLSLLRLFLIHLHSYSIYLLIDGLYDPVEDPGD